MILTTTEVAAELGVTPFAVRKMVERGDLAPLVPGARPLRFSVRTVADAQVRRMRAGEHARLDELARMLT